MLDTPTLKVLAFLAWDIRYIVDKLSHWLGRATSNSCYLGVEAAIHLLTRWPRVQNGATPIASRTAWGRVGVLFDGDVAAPRLLPRSSSRRRRATTEAASKRAARPRD